MSGIFRTRTLTVLLCLPLLARIAPAQSTHAKPSAAHRIQTTARALLVSDIHFDPFWDPAKVPQLAAAPAAAWPAIFAAPPSPDQAQQFAALAQTCHTRGQDTAYPLLAASLAALRTRAAGAAFITVSGDLIAHAFDCKYNALFPQSTPAAYQSFVEKTIQFVIAEMNSVAPPTPVYVALGNNDSGCGDYQLDAHSPFLAATGQLIAQSVPAPQRAAALQSFSATGDYTVTLPAPINNARLIVLDDLFQSFKYAGCSGKPDATAVQAQLDWLQQQLTAARAAGQKVWIMGHIPPGVNAYATLSKGKDICGGQQPAMFLSSEKLADVLTSNADVIQLALFAHTHMDEIKLLTTKDASGATKSVVLKQVPSISPIDGNNPAFTVAEIDPATAKLMDFQVVAAPDTSSSGPWQEEYDYASSYDQPDVSPASVANLLAGFAADPDAQTPASRTYLRTFDVGHPQQLMSLVWPAYVCSQTHNTADGFTACACPTAH